MGVVARAHGCRDCVRADDGLLPVYEGAGVALERTLTDNGRAYCGRPLATPRRARHLAAT
jgi:hypothetical protein